MEKHGFLEVDSNLVTKDIDTEFDGLWDLSIQTNEMANKLQYALNANTNNLHELIGAPLFIRILSNYQALLMLASKGMPQQSHILLRALVEALFPLVAISKNHDFAKEFILHDEHPRKGVLGKLNRYEESVKGNVAEIQQTAAVIEEIKNNIKEQNIKHYPTEEFSKKAGLHHWYDTVYAITSAAVHTTPRSLEEHLVLADDNETILGYKNEPDIHKIETALSTGIKALHIATEAICDIFLLEHPANLEELNQKIEKHLEKKA